MDSRKIPTRTAGNLINSPDWGGLVPSWAKDEAIATRLSNVRGESVAEKPSFRAAFRRRRCIVPANGFYEWQQIAGEKQPFYIHPVEGEFFALAGLWERWTRPADGDRAGAGAGEAVPGGRACGVSGEQDGWQRAQ